MPGGARRWTMRSPSSPSPMASRRTATTTPSARRRASRGSGWPAIFESARRPPSHDAVRTHLMVWRLPLIALVLGLIAASPTLGEAPRMGGALTLRLREDLPQGFAIHESPTISTMWPAMPCFSNLVLFDPMKPVHSTETIIGELAERWSWQDGYKKLVFLLRSGVKWHDGQPFSSKDVVHTFDVLREIPGAPAKLRLSPRRE